MKKIKKEYKLMKEFLDRISEYQIDNPGEMMPPETDDDFIVNCLKEVFLDENWFVSMPMNDRQANTILLHHILLAHSRVYRDLVYEKKKKGIVL